MAGYLIKKVKEPIADAQAKNDGATPAA
jgi:hypothetical protein